MERAGGAFASGRRRVSISGDPLLEKFQIPAAPDWA
jgi:hypothetical protein